MREGTTTSDDTRRSGVALRLGLAIICVLATAGPAGGARPLVTDDARVVDPGACQLEIWTRLGDAGDEYWALPACSPIANLELTAGVGVLPADRGGPPEHASVQLQAKTLFRSLTAHRIGVGLVAGTVLRAHGDVADLNVDRLGEVFGYVPVTVTLLRERAWLNLNLGARYRGDGAGGFLLWGAAAEVVLLGPLTAIAEAYGDAPDPAFMQGGLRLTVVPERVQIDATYGRRLPNGTDDEWMTVGLRLLSPQLFEPLGTLGAALSQALASR